MQKKTTMQSTCETINKVILYYKYITIPNPQHLCLWHQAICTKFELKGRALVSTEGINGSLSGSASAIDSYCAALRNYSASSSTDFSDSITTFNIVDTVSSLFHDIIFKISDSEFNPFPDLKIQIVKELISTGKNMVSQELLRLTGKHIKPKEFHDMISQKDSNTVLIDVRNDYEYQIGHFEGAINPKTRIFSEFTKYIDDSLPQLQDKKVMMYCTGGIRCEKASSYVRSKGIEEVYQLEGGIHTYLGEYPEGGYWKGKNYIFDQRVLQAPQNKSEVIGHCCVCQKLYEIYSGDKVCTVCRDPLLVCDDCKLKERGVYYCERHEDLKGIYYYFLDGFTEEQLEAQMAALEEKHSELLKLKKKGKNRRRTMRRQIEAILKRLAQLKSQKSLAKHKEGIEYVDNQKFNDPPCRTCSEVNCKGTCWGFWGFKQ